jgi:hypothetical protein
MKYRACKAIAIFLQIIFVFYPPLVSARAGVIEKLRNDLEGHPGEDSFRAKRMNKHAFELRNKNPKETIKLAEEALRVSRQLNYEAGTAAAFPISFF